MAEVTRRLITNLHPNGTAGLAIHLALSRMVNHRSLIGVRCSQMAKSRC
jgi:hypothetical protein